MTRTRTQRTPQRRKPYLVRVIDDGGLRILSLTQIHYEFGDAAIDALINVDADICVVVDGVSFTRLGRRIENLVP